MRVRQGMSLPIDEIDHVRPVLINDYCPAQQCIENWSQDKHFQQGNQLTSFSTNHATRRPRHTLVNQNSQIKIF